MLLAIEGIPAQVCAGCGEQFYDQATMERIGQILAAPAEDARRHIQVPVFSLDDFESRDNGGRAQQCADFPGLGPSLRGEDGCPLTG
jgi:hypothetical protein